MKQIWLAVLLISALAATSSSEMPIQEAARGDPDFMMKWQQQMFREYCERHHQS